MRCGCQSLSVARAKKALKKNGIYLNIRRDTHTDSKIRVQELLTLKELLEAGKLKPAIDRVYPMQPVVETHRYLDQGHKKGNIGIVVNQENQGQ